MPKIVNHDAYRLELLTQCFELFARYGYTNISMRQIAEEIGISTGTLYHYFSSKKELFKQITLILSQNDISQIAELAKKAKIPLLGPNCLGVIRPSSKMNASFAPSTPPQGNIAFISQSGALADSIIDWAIEARYGFSAVVSIGNRADLDIVDFLEYFAEDEQTKAITIYMEGIDDGEKFMEVAKKVSKKKPIIALKAGRTDYGKDAVSTHTGSLAGSYKIYEAAFKQAGVIVADTVEEMFDLAKVLAYQPVCNGNNVAIISNAGGPAVLCADYCGLFGINLPELKKSTINKLDKTGLMHNAYSKRNPLDIVGDALPERYEADLWEIGTRF